MIMRGCSIGSGSLSMVTIAIGSLRSRLYMVTINLSSRINVAIDICNTFIDHSDDTTVDTILLRLHMRILKMRKATLY